MGIDGAVMGMLPRLYHLLWLSRVGLTVWTSLVPARHVIIYICTCISCRAVRVSCTHECMHACTQLDAMFDILLYQQRVLEEVCAPTRACMH